MDKRTELTKALLVAEFLIIFLFGVVDVLTGITWDGYAMIHPDNLIDEFTNLQALLASAVIFFLLKEEEEGRGYSRVFLLVFCGYLFLFAIVSQLGLKDLLDPLLPPLPHYLLNMMFGWSWTNLLLACCIFLLILVAMVRNPFAPSERRYLFYGAGFQFIAFLIFLLRPNAAEEPQPITLLAYIKETTEVLSTFFYLLFFLLILLERRGLFKEKV